MRIELDRLNELGSRFSHLYEIDELSLDDKELRLTESIEVCGEIRQEGNEVELRGQVNARIETVCGRCLKPVVLPVHSQFAERFVPAVSWRSEEQHELRVEDLNLAVFDGATIELDDLVREEILLAMPGHVLCREDCKGLCPVCGIDKNLSNCRCETMKIDSRWQALGELQP
jgi:uncharacterized protein